MHQLKRKKNNSESVLIKILLHKQYNTRFLLKAIPTWIFNCIEKCIIFIFLILNFSGSLKTLQDKKMRRSIFSSFLAAAPHKTPTVGPPASYHENYSS